MQGEVIQELTGLQERGKSGSPPEDWRLDFCAVIEQKTPD
jgi:hypothetical protein